MPTETGKIMSTVTFKMEKLVRDKIYDLMLSQQMKVNFISLNNSDFSMKLKEKIVEEAKEAFETTEKADLIEEIADLLEVLYALLEPLDIDLKTVEQRRLEKRHSKGGFDKRIYIQSVELNKNNPSVELFKKQPHKYPEIQVGFDVQNLETSLESRSKLRSNSELELEKDKH
jgi:predicted house-cleaning noncanonical NTP pyrophosphatase (MazG superfamily)